MEKSTEENFEKVVGIILVLFVTVMLFLIPFGILTKDCGDYNTNQHERGLVPVKCIN